MLPLIPLLWVLQNFLLRLNCYFGAKKASLGSWAAVGMWHHSAVIWVWHDTFWRAKLTQASYVDVSEKVCVEREALVSEKGRLFGMKQRWFFWMLLLLFFFFQFASWAIKFTSWASVWVWGKFGNLWFRYRNRHMCNVGWDKQWCRLSWQGKKLKCGLLEAGEGGIP